MLTAGRHEINALRQRLAAAKARAVSATKIMDTARDMEESSKRTLDSAKQTLDAATRNHETATRNRETAKKSVESARENLDCSREEVKVVKALMEEAEGRWEVVDVDDEISTASQSSSGTGGIGATAKTSNDTSETIPSMVVVEGCGVGKVNGTYKICNRHISGWTTYWKRGRWKGEDARYEIRLLWWGWRISVSYSGNNTEQLYEYANRTFGTFDAPPINGWTVTDAGILPVPTCRIIRST